MIRQMSSLHTHNIVFIKLSKTYKSIKCQDSDCLRRKAKRSQGVTIY